MGETSSLMDDPLNFDLTYWRTGSPVRFIFGGTDEVGRGPLAGPVVAAAVLVAPPTLEIWQQGYAFLQELGITDSKKLSPPRRRKILAKLNLDFTAWQAQTAYPLAGLPFPAAFALGEVAPAEIDQINILQAALKAMQIAVTCAQKSLGDGDLILLADGNFVPAVTAFSKEAVVKGDQRSLTIALASIIAKEYRDYLMQQWDAQYPQYGWAQNAGYPTATHRAALRKYGPCPLHRKSFQGVREFC